ncbi:MAG: tRNA pseudouridine(55) synthase TruB [Acidobacteriota bacterium]
MTSPPPLSLRDGLLLVDKPTGMTSHDVVAVVRRILGIRRVGHTGTLDPVASGLLLLLTGRATRLSRVLVGHGKAYQGEGQLGWATDTYDCSGQATGPVVDASDITQEELERCARRLRGDLMQIPPPYSARKVGGVPLHRQARRGKPALGRAVPVTVTSFNVHAGPEGHFGFEAEVSSGTYLRGLVHDLGQALGCGAHLLRLERTAVGPFALHQALTLQDLAKHPTPVPKAPYFLGFDRIPLDLPLLQVEEESVQAVMHGGPFRAARETPHIPAAGLLQVRNPAGHLLALAAPASEPGTYRPRAVFPGPQECFTPHPPSGTVSLP